MTSKMNEFLDKVDALCYEYGYEIYPSIHGWDGKTDEKAVCLTLTIVSSLDNNEIDEVLYIDGDGRGN